MDAAQTFLPSDALAALLSLDEKGQPTVTTDEIIRLLLANGHLDACSVRSDIDEESSRSRWQRALKQVGKKVDVWAKYEISKRPTELCVRWDYDAVSDQWVSTETLCKMEDTSFAEGAMRECFRMKKMSQVSASFFFKMKWEECNNYVAKRYKDAETPRERYFSDIEMQMISKKYATRDRTPAARCRICAHRGLRCRYARQYNALGPPKKVDFLHAFVIEVARAGGAVLYCVERAIEDGCYVKHNNNSGFVEVGRASPRSSANADDAPAEGSLAVEAGCAEGCDEHHVHRATPHAFSRFTFEASIA